jgi:hypothetical protein
METEGKLVDYDSCPVAQKKIYAIEAGKEYITFHPAELGPGGIQFEQWHARVMSRSKLGARRAV